MADIVIYEDEQWPVYYHDALNNIGVGTKVTVPETELDYWEFVEAQYRMVQRQKATRMHEVRDHVGTSGLYGCLKCNP